MSPKSKSFNLRPSWGQWGVGWVDTPMSPQSSVPHSGPTDAVSEEDSECQVCSAGASAKPSLHTGCEREASGDGERTRWSQHIRQQHGEAFFDHNTGFSLPLIPEVAMVPINTGGKPHLRGGGRKCGCLAAARIWRCFLVSQIQSVSCNNSIRRYLHY